jgi:hypothetical protein
MAFPAESVVVRPHDARRSKPYGRSIAAIRLTVGASLINVTRPIRTQARAGVGARPNVGPLGSEEGALPNTSEIRGYSPATPSTTVAARLAIFEGSTSWREGLAWWS